MRGVPSATAGRWPIVTLQGVTILRPARLGARTAEGHPLATSRVAFWPLLDFVPVDLDIELEVGRLC